MRHGTSFLMAVAILGVFAFGTTGAQQGSPVGGAVLGTGAVTGFVENMDRSLAFYRDAFGMEVPPMPEAGVRPYNPNNPQLFAMFDIPGARERHQFARSGDVRFELMEIRDVEHRTIPLRLQDPGTVTLVFTVRDVAGSLERAKQAGATVASAGGVPVALADGTRAVLIRDVDGRYVELRQPSSGAAAEAPSLGAMGLSIAVADLPQTIAVYRDVLGFAVEAEQRLGADAALRALSGLSTAEFKRSVARAPNGGLAIEFVEYGGVDRQMHSWRIQDRGSARMQLRADDVEALVARMKSAGLRVVSQGGGPVPIPPNFMGALVADPNGFFLTPFAPCKDCAPRLQRDAH